MVAFSAAVAVDTRHHRLVNRRIDTLRQRRRQYGCQMRRLSRSVTSLARRLICRCRVVVHHRHLRIARLCTGRSAHFAAGVNLAAVLALLDEGLPSLIRSASRLLQRR